MANAAYGELVSRLLGSFIGDQSPQKDPNWQGYDDKGKPIGSTTPYQLPNWGTRFFHPDVAGAEYQGNNAAYATLLQDQIRKAINAGTVAKIRSSVGKQLNDIPNDTTAGILFPNLSSEGILSGNTAAAGQDIGLPLLTAASEVGNTARNIRSSTAALTSGLPENLVDAANASAKYGAAFDTARMPLIGPSMALEGESIAANRRRLPSMTDADISRAVESDLAAKRQIANADKLTAIQNATTDTGLSDANVAKALATQREVNTPLITATQLATIRNALFGAEHPESSQLIYRDPNTGKDVINPSAFNTFQRMKAMLGQGVDTKNSPLSIGNNKNILPIDNEVVSNMSPTRTALLGSRTHNPISVSSLASSNPEPTSKIVNSNIPLPSQKENTDISGLHYLINAIGSGAKEHLGPLASYLSRIRIKNGGIYYPGDPGY